MAMIGIDLGTTNSLAVAFIEDKYVMIPNSYQEYLTPSVVSIDEEGMIIVGKAAKERLVTHPMATTSLFKRNMGTQKTVTLKNKKYLPEELSAFVVKQLIEDAKIFLKEEIEEVVISVPAYFNEHQRNATKRIGRILDVKIERLINEPSAAALACHQGKQEDESFIVFDFGGGTLDVSVVDCFDNVVSICSIAGNNHLGGSDFDKLIAQDFCKENGVDFYTLSLSKKESILLQCEYIKTRLQEVNTIEMNVHMDSRDMKYTLTNEKLRALSEPIFIKIKKVIAEAVNSSGFENGEIDKMVLVGGSCHMPVIVDFLTTLMNIDVVGETDMDQMVVMGLGTYIGIKQRKETVKELVLTDICPFSLSTAIYNEAEPNRPLSHVQIQKNTVLPASNKATYYTIEKGQTEILFRVYQGENIYAEENIELASYTVAIPRNKVKHETVEVTFSYDINSLLCIDLHIISTNEAYRYFVGDNKESNVDIDSIKNASMKLNLEPETEYILDKVNRIMQESSPDKQVYVQELYKQFITMKQQYKNNLRKKKNLIAKMDEVLEQISYSNSNCSIFTLEDDNDDEEFLS